MEKVAKTVIANLLFIFLLAPLFGNSQQLCGKTYTNFVPDSATAIKVAEAVWLPIYGESIYKEKPYNAKLVGDSVWYVYGYLPKSYISIDSKGDTTYHIFHGGVAEIEIRKSDCFVIKVCHGK